MRSPRGLMVGVVTASVTAVLTSCGAPPTLRVADIERSLVEGFAAQVGGAFTAKCPVEVLAQAGSVIRCVVTDGADGTKVVVEVRQEDDAGDFTWRAVGIDG